MSLFKQIQLLITVLLLMTLSVFMKIDFDKMREFTSNQLYNTGKNTANVLALSLSSHAGDDAFIQTSINAMFDGGYFEVIALVDQQGIELYKQSEKIKIDGIPETFIRFVDIQVPVAEAQVISGWSIVGTLKIKAHPGPFYMKLWESFQYICIVFAILGSVTIAISFFALRYLLKSLKTIQHQAEAISNSEFIVNSSIPSAPELKKVVLAMNTMVSKVRSNYDRHLEHLKSYQALTFIDSTTGLYNRKYLINQLNQFLDSDDETAQGQVIMLSIAGMELLNLSMSHPVIDKVFKELTTLLKEETEALQDSVTAVLPRHEYAVILPNTTQEESCVVAESIMKNLQAILDQQAGLIGKISVYAGLAGYDQEDDLKTILSKTDYALSVAKSGSSGKIEAYQDDNSTVIQGKFEWKTMIENAFKDDLFTLTAQPVLSATGELHKEIYVNMLDKEGSPQRAGYFMPMVITMGLASKLDQFILEKSATCLSVESEDVLAINLTTDFCINRVSFLWLRQFLTDHKSLKNNIVFEIHEGTLVQYPEISLDISGMIKGLGFTFGIDQFSLNKKILDLLNSLKPGYIKVEQSYLYDSEQHEIVDSALNSLVTITDSLDIKLIAVKVETEEQHLALEQKNINYFQGRGVSGIAPLVV